MAPARVGAIVGAPIAMMGGRVMVPGSPAGAPGAV